MGESYRLGCLPTSLQKPGGSLKARKEGRKEWDWMVPKMSGRKWYCVTAREYVWSSEKGREQEVCQRVLSHLGRQLPADPFPIFDSTWTLHISSTLRTSSP